MAALATRFRPWQPVSHDAASSNLVRVIVRLHKHAKVAGDDEGIRGHYAPSSEKGLERLW